jgi:hypothetical protein
MPSRKVDYSKILIYKIVCNDLNIKDLYVGSTSNFVKRKSKHKGCCNNEDHKDYNLKVYQVIRENGGWDNWTMVEIEKYPCNDNNEARKRERYWFEELNANLNSCFPQRTRQEYNETIKESHVEYMKEYRPKYREENHNKILEKDKIYRDTHKEQMKKYREDNKEKIRLQQRKYYVENRETILQYTKEYTENKKVSKCL